MSERTGKERRQVLLGVGGGIAAFKVAAVASRLVQDGLRVRVAMSRSAPSFVGAVTFAGLTGTAPIVHTTQIDPDGTPSHIAGSRGTELMVIAPATADLLGRLAAGMCDDPVGLLAVTVECPVVVCPAMNDAMWRSPAVQQSVRRVRGMGWAVLGPVSGPLAEGYAAMGRMVEAEDIVADVHKRLGYRRAVPSRGGAGEAR